MLDILLWYAVFIPSGIGIFLTLGTAGKAPVSGVAKINLTWLVWWYAYIPLMLVSAFAVPVMLLKGWEGYTGPFGNRLYGRYGNKAAPSKNFFDEWVFLVLRNPISNFGKVTMSVKTTATWPWHYDVKMFGPLWIKAGWKPNADAVKNPERTFVFRPHIEV